MGQIISDDFNRADNTSLGSNYSNGAGGTFPWRNQIVSNQAAPQNNNGDAKDVFTGASWTGGADQYAEIALANLGANDYGGVLVRAATDGTTETSFVAELGGSTDANIYMYKDIAGTETQLMTAVGYTWVANDVIRLEVQGTGSSGLLVKINGTQKGTSGDASAITSGNPGLGTYTDAQPRPKVDNFAAGDFGSGTTTTIIHRLASMGVGN